MNFKKIILISLFALILSVGFVSAADLDNAYLSTSSGDVDYPLVSIGDVNLDDSKLTASAGSFDDLQVEINNAPAGSVLNLTRDYNGAYGSRIQFNKDLTIDGQGHTLNCLDEVGCSAFYSSSGNIVLKNLKIVNGHNDYTDKGGAIYITGSAQYTLENCILSNNWADDYGGAIYNEVNKPLTIINCQLNSNKADGDKGGAIYSVGDVIIKNSSFINNFADLYGGAIYAEKNVFIDNSTFKDNLAEREGGAINAKTIYVNNNQSGQSYNSFFINNKVDNSVSSQYGGALSADNVYLNNAVFKQNHAKSGGGAVIALYSSNVSNCLFESNDIEIGSGGALYFVYASAVCHIVNSEFNSNTAYDGGGAVCANHELFVDNSTFFNNHAGVTGGAIKAGYLHINAYQPNTEPLNTFFRKNTVSDSRGSSNNGGAVYADFYVHAVNAVFSENQAKVDGGAIYAKGVVNVDHCLFESNVADGSVYESYGGAIHTTTDVDVNNCTFENNSAGDYGGAISAANAYVNHEQDAGQPYNSFFINNKAGDNDGGAIYVSNEKWSVYDSLFRVKNAVFKDNQAYEDGGAIFCDDKGEVAHCSFESNKANGAKYAQCEGGAIYCKNQLTVDNSIFDNNYAYDYGGAIYSDNLAIRPYSYFDGNTAYDNHGGAIYTNKFTEDVKFVSFINNKAGEGSYDDGGAIYINGENHITFSQCVFAYNHCKGRGGAIFLDSSSSHLTLKNNIFSSNTADMDIQAVYNWGYYDAVNENFWAGINPSTSNTQLVEGKSVQSSIKHVDSNPLNLGLRLSKKTCKVNNQLWATADFSHNDGSQCFNKMFVGFITFVPTENISFSTRYDYDNSVIITLTPEKEGTYNITADLFGYNVSCELYVTFDSPFADLDDDTSPISDNNGNYDNYYGTGAVNEVLTSDLLSNQGENSTSVTNQSHSNSTAKSISQPDTAKSINSNTIILALVLVIALGAIVFWRKSKQ